jgi:excisionase family DNA binding protein
MPNEQQLSDSKPEKWSSIEDVAAHLSVHPDTIRSWIRKKVIPFHRVGKQYRFRLSDVDEWVESGKSEGIE